VVCKAPHSRRSRRPNRLSSFGQHRRVHSSHQTRSHRFDVSFNTRDLSRKKDSRIAAHLQSLFQNGRSAYESVAMYLTVSNNLRVLETRNQPQDSFLLSELQMVLKTHEVVAVRQQILLAQLDRGVRLPAGARIAQPDGLHRTIPERVPSSPRKLFDG